jgi:5-methylcytosine-specific restriction endonuclease McrA
VTRRKIRRRVDRMLHRTLGGRLVMFAPGPLLGAAGWVKLGQPEWDGRPVLLGVLVVAGFLLWPPVILAVMALLTVPHLVTPRKWRMIYRHAHGRAGARSAYIPAHLRKATLFADQKHCLSCKSATSLQIDHILPWAAGGRTWFWNLAVLCGRCNRIKSNYWHKTPHLYRPFPGADNPAKAAAIERKERWHRWNPVRMARAAWGLAA